MIALNYLSLHWPNHIRVNKLKKSSFCFILWSQGLKRSPEHLSHYTGLTRACRWAPGMQLDTFDSIGERQNCCQRVMTEMSMPDKNIFVINSLPNARVYLSVLNLIMFIKNHQSCWGRCGRGGSNNEATVDQWRMVDKYWSETCNCSIQIKLEVHSFRHQLDGSEKVVGATSRYIKNVLEYNLCWFPTSAVDRECDYSRAFSID